MNVVEVHCRGKHPDPRRCEDLVVVTDRLVAVIDGVTDKGAGTWPGADGGAVTGGRFAAELVAAHLRDWSGGDPLGLVEDLSRALFEATGRVHGTDLRPAAQFVLYDDVTGRIVRVGDCPFRIDATEYRRRTRLEEIAADFRAALLAADGPDTRPDATGTLRGPAAVDPGRAAILPLLRRATAFANRLGEFGYPVVDGTDVPAAFVEVQPVVGVEVVLASDGYPSLTGTLLEAETHLASLLTADPRCIGPLRGTKGVEAGNCSFDDRAWIRLVRD